MHWSEYKTPDGRQRFIDEEEYNFVFGDDFELNTVRFLREETPFDRAGRNMFGEPMADIDTCPHPVLGVGLRDGQEAYFYCIHCGVALSTSTPFGYEYDIDHNVYYLDTEEGRAYHDNLILEVLGRRVERPQTPADPED